jgi:hypothetical protein
VPGLQSGCCRARLPRLDRDVVTLCAAVSGTLNSGGQKPPGGLCNASWLQLTCNVVLPWCGAVYDRVVWCGVVRVRVWVCSPADAPDGGGWLGLLVPTARAISGHNSSCVGYVACAGPQGSALCCLWGHRPAPCAPACAVTPAVGGLAAHDAVPVQTTTTCPSCCGTPPRYCCSGQTRSPVTQRSPDGTSTRTLTGEGGAAPPG